MSQPTVAHSDRTSEHSARAVELSGIVRRFGHGTARFAAVDGIDLNIERGEVVALLGPNGAGKTTTIDVMLGLSEPDEGSARVLGMHPHKAVAAGRLAAVLQTGGLLSDLSAGTVRNHLSSAIGKTATENRAQAARVARDKGWI